MHWFAQKEPLSGRHFIKEHNTYFPFDEKRVQRDAVGQTLLAGRTRLYFKDTAILKKSSNVSI